MLSDMAAWHMDNEEALGLLPKHGESSGLDPGKLALDSDSRLERFECK